jgi:hypothetical protein
MKITLNYVYISIEGDYYQVHFYAREDNGSTEITDDPYFLIQRQFEMPDGDEVYIESHDDNYIGHYLVNRATLQRNKIHLELKRSNYAEIEISFKATEKKFEELHNALKTMIPIIKIKMQNDKGDTTRILRKEL